MNSQTSSSSKKFWIILSVLLFLGAGGYWSWFSSQRDVGVAQTRRITIAQAGDFFLYAPLYIAKDAGFFQKRGLDVSLVSTGGDEKTWAAVVSGSASFGVADPTFVAISESRGRPGRVIASIVNGVPFWGITLNPAIQPFTDPKSLNDYTVGTFPAPSTAYTLQKKMFIQAGLPPRIREGAFGTLLVMLKAGQVDIALELEPNVSQAATEGTRVVYAMPQIYGDFAITGLTATPELLSKQPQLAQDVVCALQLALDFTRRQPDATLKILSARFPEISSSVAKSALARVIEAGIIPNDVVINPAAWEKAIALRVEVGDVGSPKGLDAYVDNAFASRARSDCRMN